MTRVYRGWERSPPTHKLAAAFMGFKPPKKGAVQPGAEPVQSFRQEFPGGTIR